MTIVLDELLVMPYIGRVGRTGSTGISPIVMVPPASCTREESRNNLSFPFAYSWPHVLNYLYKL